MASFQQYPITKVVEIEGVTITVPLFTRFISVDFTGCVQAHDKKVRFDDGWVVPYHHDTTSVTVGVVDRECPNRLPMDIYELPSGA